MQSSYLENVERDGKIALRFIVGKEAVRTGSGWNYLRTGSSAGLWFLPR
jgi:hypothetical protein